MDTRSREFETGRLGDILERVRRAARSAEAEKAELDAKIDAWLKAYDDENVELFMQLVVGTDMQQGLARQLRVYKNAENSPYFGRVDFREEGGEERMLYIGRGGITEDGADLVIDWRTPAANLYYDGAPGPASYVSPDGEVAGEMSLKRTYNIKGGVLEDFYDADLITNDELLQEYLAKNADVVLRDIVATIQSDQNEIIRCEPWRNVIVQGVAGSGKTTVALHRLAYLIFGESVKESRYCIVGTNRMFLNYVSGMLPDLGVESIRQTVMRDLFLYILFYPPETKAALSAPGKSSAAFSAALREFINAREERIFLGEDVPLGGEILLSREEIAENFALRPSVPMRERAENLRALLEYRIKSRLPGILARIEDDFDRRIRAAEERVQRDRLIDAKYERLRAVRAEPRAVRRFFLDRIGKVNERALYGEFLREYAARGTAEAAAAASGSANLRKKSYDLEDLAALAYISVRLDANSRTGEYDHLVIDEAQDFGPAVFTALTECFRAARFTVLGDIAQNIKGGEGLASWDEIAPMFPSLYFRPLTKSYRNTIEIAEVANRVLERIATGYEITPVARHGRGVDFRRAGSFREAAALAAQAVAGSERRGGSAAVICRDAAEAAAAHKLLSGDLGASLIGEDTALYTGGVVVAPVAAVKGLEFDTVVVFDAGAERYSKDSADAKRLYVALTRALHELTVIYTGELTELLS